MAADQVSVYRKDKMNSLKQIFEHVWFSLTNKHTHEENPTPQIFKTHPLEWTPHTAKKARKVKQ